MQLAEIDLLDLDVFAERVPHDWFDYLRAEAPVYRHPEPHGPGFWVVTKHADIAEVSHDWEHNSSDAKHGGIVGLQDLITPEQQAQSDVINANGKMMPALDPPEHTRYRKLVNRGFTPRMIGQLEEAIREQAVAIIDKAIAKGECDLVVDVAAELPLQAIAQLLGVPHGDRHKIFDWSNRLIGSDDPEYAVESELTVEAAIEMWGYAQGLAAQRREQPRDDIVSALLAADIDGDCLTQQDFNLFFLTLAVAGNETTRNAISHAAQAFIENPDQYARLVEDRSLSTSATEEILRWATPALYFRRNVTAPFELRGQRIEAGDKVSIWYISGNRDEDVFDEPFRFDIGRDPNPHQAFGGGGPHFCLGASLARLEIRVLIEELAARVRRLEGLGPPQRLRSNFINGIKHLPVRLHIS